MRPKRTCRPFTPEENNKIQRLYNEGMEKSNGVDGVVHHALKSHWIVTDKNKLAAILKAFPEGAEVELFICAKKEKNDK